MNSQVISDNAKGLGRRLLLPHLLSWHSKADIENNHENLNQDSGTSGQDSNETPQYYKSVASILVRNWSANPMYHCNEFQFTVKSHKSRRSKHSNRQIHVYVVGFGTLESKLPMSNEHCSRYVF